MTAIAAAGVGAAGGVAVVGAWRGITDALEPDGETMRQQRRQRLQQVGIALSTSVVIGAMTLYAVASTGRGGSGELAGGLVGALAGGYAASQL